MKKSFQIFKRDLGRLFRNRAAVLILVGISVLPSLYAWFNIAANMDPYGNTKGIQVAIANEDKGADSEQMSLDAGQNIVDNLKKNEKRSIRCKDRILCPENGCDLWAYFHPGAEDQVGKLQQRRESQLQLEAGVDAAGSSGLCCGA